jgi:hypothetical protein
MENVHLISHMYPSTLTGVYTRHELYCVMLYNLYKVTLEYISN